LDALVHWLNEPPGRGEVVGFERQPEVGRMLWVLKALHTSLAVSGLRQFLETGMIGRHLYDAERWARQLGAMRTAVYLTRAAALSPSGRIPVQDEERFAFLESLEGTNANPFSRIDQEYRDAVLDGLAPISWTRVKQHDAPRTPRDCGSRGRNAAAAGCRTARCRRTHPPAPRPACDRSDGRPARS